MLIIIILMLMGVSLGGEGGILIATPLRFKSLSQDCPSWAVALLLRTGSCLPLVGWGPTCVEPFTQRVS